MLWLPAYSEEASKAKSELQYSLRGQTKTNSGGIVKLYHEVPGYVAVPRHYLDLSKVKAVYKGPLDFPLLEGQCSIEPCSAIQQEAMDFLAEYGPDPARSDCIISLRCGEGKTFIAIMEMFRYGYATIIFGPTTDILRNEWEKNIKLYTEVQDVGEIISGSYNIRPITLALYDSFLALPSDKKEDLRNRFGLLIFDEVHHASARTFSEIASFFPCRRIGLSATLSREDGLSWVYYTAFGRRIFQRNSTRKKATVIFKDLNINDVDYEHNYARSVSALEKSEQYLFAIESEIRGGFTNLEKQLIICSRKSILYALSDRIKDLNHGINVYETDPEERINNLKTKSVILSIERYGKEGLSEPSLTTVRIITPFKDRNAATQIIGRLERGETSKPMVAYFYWPTYEVFMRTRQRAKRGLIRSGYEVKEGNFHG